MEFLAKIKNFPAEFLEIFVDMGFYLLIGMFFSGLLRILISKRKIVKLLGKKSHFATIKAALLGVPLPLCSCGVIPTAVTLSKNGATPGAVTSFLISTPQTGIDSIIATYGLMGPVFAIFRPFAAFFSGILGGYFVQICDKIHFKKAKPSAEDGASASDELPPVTEAIETLAEENCCCHHHHDADDATGSACEHHHSAAHCHGSCCSGENDDIPKGFGPKMKELFRFGFLDFTQELVWELIGGMIVAALISTFIDKELIQNWGITEGLPAMLIMVAIGIPMYICAVSSIPLAVTFLGLGFSPGAVFVFLFAGPVTNAASITVLGKALGKKVLSLYLISVTLLSLFFGWILDLIVEAGDFWKYIPTGEAIGTHSHLGAMDIIEIVGACLFTILLLRAIILRIKERIGKWKMNS